MASSCAMYDLGTNSACFEIEWGEPMKLMGLVLWN